MIKGLRLWFQYIVVVVVVPPNQFLHNHSAGLPVSLSRGDALLHRWL